MRSRLPRKRSPGPPKILESRPPSTSHDFMVCINSSQLDLFAQQLLNTRKFARATTDAAPNCRRTTSSFVISTAISDWIAPWQHSSAKRARSTHPASSAAAASEYVVDCGARLLLRIPAKIGASSRVQSLWIENETRPGPFPGTDPKATDPPTGMTPPASGFSKNRICVAQPFPAPSSQPRIKPSRAAARVHRIGRRTNRYELSVSVAASCQRRRGAPFELRCTSGQQKPIVFASCESAQQNFASTIEGSPSPQESPDGLRKPCFHPGRTEARALEPPPPPPHAFGATNSYRSPTVAEQQPEYPQVYRTNDELLGIDV